MAPAIRDTHSLAIPEQESPDAVIPSEEYLALQIAALCLGAVVVVILVCGLAVFLRRSLAMHDHHKHIRLSSQAAHSHKSKSNPHDDEESCMNEVYIINHENNILRAHTSTPANAFPNRATGSESLSNSISESVEYGEVRYAHRTRVSLVSASTTTSPMASLKRQGIVNGSKKYGGSAESIAARLNEVGDMSCTDSQKGGPECFTPLKENRKDSLHSTFQFVLSPPTPSASTTASPLSSMAGHQPNEADIRSAEVEILDSPTLSHGSDTSTVELHDTVDRAFYPQDYPKEAENEKYLIEHLSVPLDAHVRVSKAEDCFDSGYFRANHEFAPGPHDVPLLIMDEPRDATYLKVDQTFAQELHPAKAQMNDTVYHEVSALASQPVRARQRLNRASSLLDSEFSNEFLQTRRVSQIPRAINPARRYSDSRQAIMNSLMPTMMATPRPQSQYEPGSYFSPPDSPVPTGAHWPAFDAAKDILRRAWAKTSHKLFASGNSGTEDRGTERWSVKSVSDSLVGRSLEPDEEFGRVNAPDTVPVTMPKHGARRSGADTPISRTSCSSVSASLLPQLTAFPNPPSRKDSRSHLHAPDYDDTFTIDSDPFRGRTE